MFSTFHVLFCYQNMKLTLTLKRLGKGGQLDPPCGFSKIVFSIEGWSSVFVTFNMILSHIFPKHFFEIPQVVQNIWRFSSSWIFLHSLLQRTYWRQHKTDDISIFLLSTYFLLDIKLLHLWNTTNSTNSVRNLSYFSLLYEHNIETYARVRYWISGGCTSL